MLIKLLPDSVVPKDLPGALVFALICACLIVGLSGLRYGGLEGWLHVFENWLLMLVIIPCATALLSLPIKYRDPSFDVRMAYYLGMFVAFLFMLAKLRYWR